jgi:hypothetical protein
MNELFFVMGILGSVAAIAALAGLVHDHLVMKARIRQRIRAIVEARP